MTASRFLLSFLNYAITVKVKDGQHAYAGADGTPERSVGCALKAYVQCGSHDVAGVPEMEEMFKRLYSKASLREFMASCPESDCTNLQQGLMLNEVFSQIASDETYLPGDIAEQVHADDEAAGEEMNVDWEDEIHAENYGEHDDGTDMAYDMYSYDYDPH